MTLTSRQPGRHVCVLCRVAVPNGACVHRPAAARRACLHPMPAPPPDRFLLRPLISHLPDRTTRRRFSRIPRFAWRRRSMSEWRALERVRRKAAYIKKTARGIGFPACPKDCRELFHIKHAKLLAAASRRRVLSIFENRQRALFRTRVRYFWEQFFFSHASFFSHA